MERLLIVLVCIALHKSGSGQTPGPARNLRLSFMEDSQLPQHAIFDFSWTPPQERTLLSGYQLWVEHVPPDDLDSDRHSCNLMQDTVIETIPRDDTAFRLRSTDSSLSSLPIYTCMYRAWLVSLPGDSMSNMLNISVKYNSPMQRNIREPNLDLKCETVYDPTTVMYTFNATVDLSNQNPLIIEALLAHKVKFKGFKHSVIPSQGEDEIDKTTRYFLEENVTEVTVLTLRPFLDDLVIVQVIPPNLKSNTEEFYWRSPAFPEQAECSNIPIPFMQPTQIAVETIVFPGGVQQRLDQVEFTVQWDPPEFVNGELDHYEVCLRFSERELEGEELCGTAPRTADTASLAVQALQIGGPELAVQVRAVNEADLNGNWSDAAFLNTSVDNPTPTQGPDPSPDGVPVWVFGVIGGVVLATLVALVVVTIFIANRRYCFHWCSKEEPIAVNPLDDPPPIWRNNARKLPEVDEWEIKREDVELLDKALGEGAFGAVYKGVLQPKVMEKLSRRKKAHKRDRRFSMKCVVAVKMLKEENLVASEKVNFVKEIEMMKGVSGGENALRHFVVNMLGCVTTQEPMLLILEFVSHGDLQSYLRAIRKKFTEAYFNPEEGDPGAPYLEPTGAYSSLKPKEEEYEKLGLISERNLVDFARQIAAGMEYLSSLEIIHRDLACRNVLVGEGKALKIADFGMSRLLPSDEVYVPTSHGPLPLRWMAIEALFYRHFTTKTDVWSYGVVLWEICTMGGFPYPTTSNRDLPEKLRSGYRMERPETCSEEVYEVMLDCWSLEHEERPNFPQLHKIFDDYLTQQTKEHYPYMEVLSKPYHFSEDTNAVVNITIDADPTPINLDIEITDVDAVDFTSDARTQELTRSASHCEPRTHLGLTQSASNLSLRSLQENMQAEMARQSDWLVVGERGEGREGGDTRYVDSPTSFTRNDSRRQQHNTQL